jgi:hypothetical protein
MLKPHQKTGLIFIPALIFLLACIAKTNDDIRSVRFVYSLDSFIGKERQFITVTDSVDVYNYKTYKIYVSSWTAESLNVDKKGIAHLIYSKVNHAYFIANEREKKGYWYNDYSVNNPSVKDVDSLLTKRFAKNFPFYIEGNQKLINKTTRNDIDIETYVCVAKKDRSYYDTLTYYFDKRLKNAPYAISPFLDSTRNSKLSKVNIVYNPQPADKQDPATPRRGYRFELKPIRDVGEESKVIALVERLIVAQSKK